MTLPVALAGHDLIGQAQTGTGKTLGFGIPLLQRVVAPARRRLRRRSPRPASRRRWSSPRPASSRVQVAGDLERAGKDRGVRVLTVYGGRAYEPQVEALQDAASRSSSAPRAGSSTWPTSGHLDLVARAQRSCSTRPTRCSTWASCPTSSGSCAMTPETRQTMLFSATMPGAIVALARTLHAPPDAHPRRVGDDDGQTVAGRPRSSSTGPTTWTRPRCSPASCRPRTAA